MVEDSGSGRPGNRAFASARVGLWASASSVGDDGFARQVHLGNIDAQLRTGCDRTDRSDQTDLEE
jgi:hypothetical protein